MGEDIKMSLESASNRRNNQGKKYEGQLKIGKGCREIEVKKENADCSVRKWHRKSILRS